MMTIHTTLAAAGILALMFAALSVNVSIKRNATRVSLGDGAAKPGAAALAVAIRIHGNFAEYVPLALILLGGIEYTGASHLLVLGLALTLVIARVLHPIGLTIAAPNAARALGAALTYAVLIVEGITALLLAV